MSTKFVGTSTTTKSVEPFVDPGNLLIVDRDPLGFDNKKEFVPTAEELLNITRNNAQHLFNEIWKLPRSTFEDATCAELPATKYVLPREKPIPQKAPLTRWQRFAQSKGIQSKSNREKKVYDDQSETWKPRYGYNRAGDDKDWLIEIPGNGDPNADYFQDRKNSKNERVAKNQLQNLQNVKRQFNNSNKSFQDGFQSSFNRNGSSAKGANAIPLGIAEDSRIRTKKELGYQIHNAKQATASAGKFQNKLKGEKTPNLGIKRKFEPNEQDSKSERTKQFAILERMAKKKPKINQARIDASAEASFQNNKRN